MNIYDLSSRRSTLVVCFTLILLAVVCAKPSTDSNANSTAGQSDTSSTSGISNSPSANADPSQSANQHTSSSGATADLRSGRMKWCGDFTAGIWGELRASNGPLRTKKS